ncbi:MAG: hypothetical protein U0793_05535 [Gemmataceae bacterium]
MSTPVPSSTQEPLTYQPLSAFAVVGFAVSVVYAAFVLFAGYFAIRRGDPLLMPGYWLLLPIAGATLSLLGRSHIRNSEGARAGMKLTRWGLGLSVCFGVAYFVYALGTGLAIRQQANSFLMEPGADAGFFAHLKKGGASDDELADAFLLTLPPSERSGDRLALIDKYTKPDADGNPGQLMRFADHPIVRLFLSGAAEDVRVEPLGVREWEHEKTGFKVVRYYRISNEEEVAEAVVTVQSQEGEKGQTRNWKMSLRDSGVESKTQKPAGAVLTRLRQESVAFLQNWLNNRGKAGSSFKEIDGVAWDKVVAPRRKVIQEAIDGKRYGRFEPKGDTATWRRHEGKLALSIPFKLDVKDETRGDLIVVFGRATVTSQESVATFHDSLKPTWEMSRITVSFAGKQAGKGYASLEAE